MKQPIRFSALCVVSLFSIISTVACASAQPRPPAPPPSGNAEKVLLSDGFDQYSPQWRQVRGQWGVQGGMAMQARDDAREMNTIMFFEPLTIADADISTSAKMTARLPQFTTAADTELIEARRSIAGAGIVFRYQDENNFYMFRLAGEEGAVLGKMQDGQWRDLANPRAADFGGARIQMDTPYELRVRVQGQRIQCWINNRAVANLEDSTFSTGRLGLVTFRTQAAFDYIRVVER